MPKFKLKITKEIIEESLLCGTEHSVNNNVSENCAFSCAYNKLIPLVSVGFQYASFMDIKTKELIGMILLTENQRDFVFRFDSLSNEPKRRFELVGNEFEVEIPQKVIDHYYNINEATEILNKQDVLELILTPAETL